MVFSLWTLGTTLFNFCQFCHLCVAEGSIINLPVVLSCGIFSVIAYFCWKSTDTPNDIPAPPPPPFVITIRPTNNLPTQQNTIQDIRLFSPPQPYLSRLVRHIHTRRTERLPQGSSPARPPLLSNQPHQSIDQAQLQSNRHLTWFRHGRLRPTSRSLNNLFRSLLHLFLYYRMFPRPVRTPNPVIQSSSSPVENPQSETEVSRRTEDFAVAESDESSSFRAQGVVEEINLEMGSTPQGQPVKFTIKFLNDTQLEVITCEDEKIGQFKRRQFSQELREKKIVRLIFNGRVIDDGVTLKEAGIFEDCVVHCLTVTPPPSTPTEQARVGGSEAPDRATSTGMNQRRGLEPGFFFVTLLGVILIILWFICFNFGQQLFTQSAVVSLSVLTGIFLIGLAAFYVPVHPDGTNRT